MGWMRVVASVALGMTLGCQRSDGAFECTTNAQCGADGTCQSTSYCSFPDTTCPSEQRYGSLAGDGLADTCVPVESPTTSETMVEATSAGSTGDASTSSADTGPATSSGGSSGTTVAESSDTGGDTDMPDPVEPIVWYPFDVLDGSTVPDLSGNGIDGTCTECGALVSGVSGQALEFGTVQNVVTAEHDPALEWPRLTVATWIRQSSTECMSIASKPLEGDANTWQLYTCPGPNGTQDLVGFITTANQSAFVASFDPPEGEFVHVAMTYDGDTLRLYVDGVMELSEVLNHDLQHSDSPLIVGGEDNGAGMEFPFQGAMDDFRVYARALPDAEVAALASGR